MLAYVNGSWHKVLRTRNVVEREEYLLASFDWWIADRWVNAERVENTMDDVGQFD